MAAATGEVFCDGGFAAGIHRFFWESKAQRLSRNIWFALLVVALPLAIGNVVCARWQPFKTFGN